MAGSLVGNFPNHLRALPGFDHLHYIYGVDKKQVFVFVFVFLRKMKYAGLWELLICK